MTLPFNLHFRIIQTIFSKDFIDAIRDGRVLIAVLVPIGLGVFYGLTFDDDTATTTPTYEVAYTSYDATDLPAVITGYAGDDVNLTFVTYDNVEAVEDAVRDDDAVIGLVIPAGFDEAVQAGGQPTLGVIQPPDTGFGTRYVLATLDPALRALAGQEAPAAIQLQAVTDPDETAHVFERVGLASFFVLFSIIFLVGMIAMLAIPVILAEEAEKKTLDALVMIASYGDVIIGKALVGIVYTVIAIVITLVLTPVAPDNMLLFFGSLALLTVCLIGFGLWLGGFFKSANQLNTWSGVILLPVISPAFLVAVPLPTWADISLQLFPVSAGTRLAANGLAGEAIFGNPMVSWVVMLVWAVVGYTLLFWQLSRRQA